MYSDRDFNLLPLFFIGGIIVLALWGCWELVDWLFIDDVVISSTPIIPVIELVISNGRVDTMYVYHQP